LGATEAHVPKLANHRRQLMLSVKSEKGEIFKPFQKLRYHHGEGENEGYAITTSEFLHPATCRTIVSLCEAHVDRIESTLGCHHPWREGFGDYINGVPDYRYATVDLEVDQIPQLVAWLRDIDFVDVVARRIERSHGVRITAFDDMFVVKYNAAGQRELVRHVDGGDVSFMVALNPGNDPGLCCFENPFLVNEVRETRSEFGGGGTRFDVLADGSDNMPLQLRQGEVRNIVY